MSPLKPFRCLSKTQSLVSFHGSFAASKTGELSPYSRLNKELTHKLAQKPTGLLPYNQIFVIFAHYERE